MPISRISPTSPGGPSHSNPTYFLSPRFSPSLSSTPPTDSSDPSLSLSLSNAFPPLITNPTAMSAAAAATAAGAYPSPTPLRPRRPTLTNLIKFPPFSHLPPPLHHPHRHHLLLSPTASSLRPTATSVSGEGAADRQGFDALLSVAEVACIAPPAVYSIGWLLASVVPGGWKAFRVQSGSRVFVFQFLLLAGAVAIGGIIRRRQWRRICGARTSSGSCASSSDGVDLIARIEKLEEDTRSSGTMVRVLSRQLEKLGIRFRLTRRTLKDPIAETTALTQKNSEATRALAMQEDILEKELGEIQKVLLAMQEQQRKQLELILAIGKARRLFDKQDIITEQVPKGTGNMTTGKEEVKPLEIQTGTRSGGNDRV